MNLSNDEDMSENNQQQLNRNEQGRHDRRMVFECYDFLRPFCYVGQHRTAIHVSHGLHVAELPLQAPGHSVWRHSSGPAQWTDVCHG
jgi:hypothetical protein